MRSKKTKRMAIIGVVLAVLLSCLFACAPAAPETPEQPQTVDLTQLTYVAFGDSITYGVDGETQQRMQKPYPQLVAESLELKDFENYGVSGASIVFRSTSFVGTQLEGAISKADIVSVMIGVNDFLGSHTLGTIDSTTPDCVYGGLNYLASELLKKYPNAFIFFMTPLNQTKSPAVNSADYTLEDVAKAVKEVCAAKNIPVLDLYTTVDFSAETDPNSDGLHPTQKFARDYTAPKIAQFIKDSLQPNQEN